jgi:hypothetical protein
MGRYLFVLLAGLWAAAPVSAGSWADSLFEELSKDFGAVPRGPTLSHPFRLTNNTANALHISSVRVSCGCVSASAAQDDLAPGQTTTVDAKMDTNRFSGHKSVTIFVQFDQPSWEEVRLVVQANGRDDVSVTPEAFHLGQAKRGTSPAGSVTATFYGTSDAQITEVLRESNYVLTELNELKREGGTVSYQVKAAIRSDAPVGKWYTDVWLKTNNPSMPKVRVPLTVEIESALTVSPGDVNFGTIKPGATAERKIIVRGVKPFRIVKIEGVDDQLKVSDSAKDSKAMHVLTVALKPTKSGELSRKLKVITDLKEDSEVEFEAKAQVKR